MWLCLILWDKFYYLLLQHLSNKNDKMQSIQTACWLLFTARSLSASTPRLAGKKSCAPTLAWHSSNRQFNLLLACVTSEKQPRLSSWLCLCLQCLCGLNNKRRVYSSGSWNAGGYGSLADSQDVKSVECLCCAVDGGFRQLVDAVVSSHPSTVRRLTWWFYTVHCRS